MTTNMTSDSTHAALAGCGERLRVARVAAGLAIEDVATRLRMPVRVVQSLEAEDWSRLGAPVFVRGQVRSYSRLLGLGTTAMMDALDVAPVEPTKLVSRTHTPKMQWWAEQIGRRLVYVVLTLSLAIPAWVATRNHLAVPAQAVAALDTPVDSALAGEHAGSRTPRTVIASMTPMAATVQPAAPNREILLRTSGKTWLQVVGRDGETMEQTLLAAGAERRYATTQVQRITIGDASVVTLETDGHPVEVATHARANVARFAVSSDGSLVATD